MKYLYNFLFAMIASSIAITVGAQGLNSSYFTEGMTSRHDLNPAFGNEQSYISMPMLGNVNIKMMGNFGYKDIVLNNPHYGDTNYSGYDKKMTTFMNPYITDALSGFNTDINKVSGQVMIGVLSAGFKAFKGYNTVEINIRSNIDARLPYQLFEFARNTGNKYYDIGNINVGTQNYTELAFGHSHQISDRLRIGAKVKFLLGVANGTFEFTDVKADLSGTNEWKISGSAKADVSMKGFKYKSETKDYKNQYNGHQQYERVNDVDVDGAGISGFGMGFDLGAVYKVNEDITVSAAFLDLGFINWSNDMQAINNEKQFTFSGFHDTSVTSDRGTTIDSKMDDYSDQLSNFANLQDHGDQGSRTTALGATINIGCEYVLPAYRPISFGLLSSTRINGKYSWTEGRLSTNYKPLEWLDGGINIAINSYTASMGWILNIHPKSINFFIGMDHLIGKVSKEFIPLSSNASICMGLNFTW